jgi:hypothetical protein
MMCSWSKKFRKNENYFYSSEKTELFKIRYSEVFAFLNCLQAFQRNPFVENSHSVEDISQLIEHIEFIQDWATHLLEDPEIQSSEVEIFYANLLKKNFSWLVVDLKIAYYTKIGMAEKKILTFKRLDINELNRKKSKLKKRLRLRRKESLSYYLSCFN